MNRYLLIRRLMGPAILLLIGVLALLHQAGLTPFWKLFWPLLLILIGVIKLAERAALAGYEYPPYPDAYTGQTPPNPPSNPGSSIVPSQSTDLPPNGGER